jgi:hypothetical protein
MLWNRDRSARVWSPFRIVLAGFLLVQAYGTVSLHPFGLSFYNALAGGLSGAERLGLELTYWNDAVDQVLLDRLAREGQPGSTSALVPTLYPRQGLLTTNRALARAGIILQDEREGTRAEWVVVSRRTAYWPREFRNRLESGAGHRIIERSRQGVWLSALWHFEPHPPPELETSSPSSRTVNRMQPPKQDPSKIGPTKD